MASRQPLQDWIRLMYFYPMYISDELIERIADSRRIVPYVDMPLQHINDNMLRRMARRVTRAETEDLLGQLRRSIPGLAVRTTFITGFPGETDEEYQELAEFIGEQRFEHVGVFTYSLEADTPAARLPGHVASDVMELRRDGLMKIQQEIAFARNESLVGDQVEVILDQSLPQQDNVWVGRTAADAPDVDGLVYATGSEWPLRAGMLTLCEIVATKDYDLVGVAVGPPS